MPFDAISYLLAKKAMSKGIMLPTLKNLVIDISKDWQGYRIKNLGEPVEPHDAARRLYVDEATTGLGINYYLLDAADSEVSIYKQLSLNPPELTEAYVEYTSNSAGDYEIGSWIAPVDSIPVLRLGVYTTHFQAEKVSGGISVRFFFRLYERDSGGSETLIAESSLSDLVDDRRDVITSLVLASDYELAEGSRLILKIYVRYLSSGPSTTVRLYYQGAVRSRLATPIAKEILDRIYAGITHASRHTLGGADELSLDAGQIISGLLSVDRIPSLDASKITSGVFDVARIPDLDASKITSGVFDLSRIPNVDWTRISDNFPRAIGDLISSTFSRSWISDLFSSPFWDNIPDKPSVFPPDLHASSHALGGADELSLDASQIASGTLSASRIPSLDASKITSGVFDADRIPDLLRSKITDFFNSPFWDNIPDKPSVFPPDSHNHIRSDITDLFDSPFWSNIPDVPALKIGDGSSTKITYNIGDVLNFIAGNNIDISFDDTENKLTISAAGATDTYKVKADVDDSSPDYLSGKVDGSTIVEDPDNHYIKVGSVPPDSISPQGDGSGLDADTVDGEHASAFTHAENGGKHIWVQSNAPTAINVGDIWIQTE